LKLYLIIEKLGGGRMSFEPTYKELKQYKEGVDFIVDTGFEPTYKELKRNHLCGKIP